MGEEEFDGAFSWSAGAAGVGAVSGGAAVAGEIFLAVGAGGGPAAGGHGGGAVEAFGTGAELGGDAFPFGAVAGARAGEGVGDFVEDGVADGGFGVVQDEVEGEFDAAAARSGRGRGCVCGG